MVPSRFRKEYRYNEISTSSQGKLIVMMYEGAVKFVNLAIDGIDSKNLSKKGTYINKAHDIINELSLALDMKKGGEVAEKLEALYQYILHQLTLANIKSDRKALESILNVLVPLLEAWTELFARGKNNNTDNDQCSAKTPPKNIASQC